MVALSEVSRLLYIYVIESVPVVLIEIPTFKLSGVAIDPVALPIPIINCCEDGKAGILSQISIVNPVRGTEVKAAIRNVQSDADIERVVFVFTPVIRIPCPSLIQLDATFILTGKFPK